MAIGSTPSHRRVIACVLAMGVLTSLVAACDGNGSSSATAPANAGIAGSSEQVQASVGDATVYVTAIQTSAIPAEVAREHAITQRDDLVMLRVSPRKRDSNGEIVSAQVQVQAMATQAGAAPQQLPLEQVVANGLVDHMGTLEVKLPATVGFQVTVTTPGGASETLTVTGDFRNRP